MSTKIRLFLLKPRNRDGLAVTFVLLSILLVKTFVAGRMLGGLWDTYVLPSALWILLGLFIVYRLSKARPAARQRFRTYVCWLAFIAGMMGVLALVAAGLIDGFGRSPYDHSLAGIVTNVLYLAAVVGGMEISRAWLINAWLSKRPVLGIALTGFLYSLFWFPLTRFLYFQDGLDAVKYVGTTCLPYLSESILASYLAFLGGWVPAAIYQGTLLAFHWLSPVLPNLSWIINTLLGTFVPIFGLALVHQLYRGEAVRSKRVREAESPVGWIVVSAVSVLVIWFSVGVFSVFPSAIVSGSMSPAIDKGDVVIIKRVTPEEVAVGDVIQFRVESMPIAHRVVAIEEREGGFVFRTKGDANPSVDTDPVLPEQVVGKVVMVVPKVGWATIALRSSD